MKKIKEVLGKVASKARSMKASYDAAYEKGQQRPSAQELKRKMKYGYRP